MFYKLFNLNKAILLFLSIIIISCGKNENKASVEPKKLDTFQNTTKDGKIPTQAESEQSKPLMMANALKFSATIQIIETDNNFNSTLKVWNEDGANLVLLLGGKEVGKFPVDKNGRFTLTLPQEIPNILKNVADAQITPPNLKSASLEMELRYNKANKEKKQVVGIGVITRELQVEPKFSFECYSDDGTAKGKDSWGNVYDLKVLKGWNILEMAKPKGKNSSKVNQRIVQALPKNTSFYIEN